MIFSRVLGSIDRVQRSRLFKIIYSIVIVLAAITVYASFSIAEAQVSPWEASLNEAVDRAADADAAATQEFERVQAVLNELLGGGSMPGGLGAGLAIATALLLVTVWIDLGLTFLLLTLVALFANFVMIHGFGWRLAGQLVLGMTLLTQAFAALLRGARLVLARPTPIFSIASNVLQEAVRLRLSMVFIVIIILGLAGLPMVLDSEQALRYRVQSFLQYSMGGSFWIVALLTLTFGVATVAFEQRDKVIWQTMTKPVSPLQYVVGKWLGVSVLAAILMAVCAAGSFLFVEYLRDQPAAGEVEAFVSGGSEVVSDDRLILETQVLAARVGVGPDVPLSVDSEDFQQIVAQFIANERIADESFATDPRIRARVEQDLFKDYTNSFFSVGPGQNREFVFKGLGSARDSNRPVTLQYRVDAAGNRPDTFYHISIALLDGTVIPRQIGLGVNHTLTIGPQHIDDSGNLEIALINGRFDRVQGQFGIFPNETSISIPQSELEVSYRAGHYGWNFARIALVLWIKLAFLAAVAVWGATFLSFPVACLVAIGVFLMAESTGFMTEALDLYGTRDADRNVLIHRVISYWIASGVNSVFSVYNQLRPTERLVEGRLLSWSSVFRGTGVLAGLSVVFLALGALAMRRRELAIYSGR